MTDLISVVVPIYGIDKYLGLCIESIINQTYENLEIILVDDGSPDRCPELCDLYAQKDKRIKVIHKPNGGLVSARKAGLRESCGKYISCVDGDDWIAPTFIESLYAAAAENGADMVCAGFTRDLFSKSARLKNTLPAGVYSGARLKDLKKRMISHGDFYRPGITTYVWNKLFLRRIVLEPQSTVDVRISIGEDAAVTYPALLACEKVVVTDNTDYHYRQREDSMLKKYTDYASEAEKLKYLYDYLSKWAEKTDPEYGIVSQVEDYVLANALMRSGGRLPYEEYSTFDSVYYGKMVVVFSAGTFGQQLVNRLNETGHCRVVGWIDDDYWEYRRCCLNVDPVDSIKDTDYDYVLIAKVDGCDADGISRRLADLGADPGKILKVTISENKKKLIDKFLDVKALREYATDRKTEAESHA